MDERQRYQQGIEMRRAVLGDAYVDAALKNRNEFNGPFQDFAHALWVGRNLDQTGSSEANQKHAGHRNHGRAKSF